MREQVRKSLWVSVCLVTIVGALSILSGLANAQSLSWTCSTTLQGHSRDSRSYFDFGEPSFTSVIQSPDGSSADIRVTTSSAMFSFMRTEKSKDIAKGAYFAVRDLTIEVSEHGDAQPVLTRNRIDTLYVNSYDQSVAKDDWHAISERIALPKLDPKKQYSIHLEIRDGLLNKSAMHPVVTDLRVPNFSNSSDSNGIAIGDISLFDTLQGVSGITLAKGNTYMFSRDVIGTVSFETAGSLPSEPLVDVRIRQVSNVIDPSDTGERSRMVLDMRDLYKDSAMQFQSAGQDLSYTLISVPPAPATHGVTGAAAPGPHIWTAIFTAPGKTFDQGKYEIAVHVKDGNVERTHTNDFMLVWQNMPLSLMDPIDAIQPLEHIMTSTELSSLNSGGKQDMVRKLYAYWKKQDPTPGTAYNERMDAFYKRVDYADFNFANTRMLNGVMTDRGKVYLLYGSPTKVERAFIPGEVPTETWTYANNVKQAFVFEDVGGHGDYHLTDVKNLASAY